MTAVQCQGCGDLSEMPVELYRTPANNGVDAYPIDMPLCTACAYLIAEEMGDWLEKGRRNAVQSGASVPSSQLALPEVEPPADGLDACRVCGCTELDACVDGCAWTDAARDLCTACVDALGGALLMREVIVELLFPSDGSKETVELTAETLRAITAEEVARMATVIPGFEHEGVHALSPADLRAVAQVVLERRAQEVAGG